MGLIAQRVRPLDVKNKLAFNSSCLFSFSCCSVTQPTSQVNQVLSRKLIVQFLPILEKVESATMNKICRLITQASACHALSMHGVTWCACVCALQVCQYKPETSQDSIPLLSFFTDFVQPSPQDIEQGETHTHFRHTCMTLFKSGSINSDERFPERVYNELWIDNYMCKWRVWCVKIVVRCHSFTALPAQTEKVPKLKVEYVDGQCALSPISQWYFIWVFFFFYPLFPYHWSFTLSAMFRVKDKPNKVQAKLT